MPTESGRVATLITSAHASLLASKFLNSEVQLRDAIHHASTNPMEFVDYCLGAYTLCRLHAIYFYPHSEAEASRNLSLLLIIILHARANSLKSEDSIANDDLTSVTSPFIASFIDSIQTNPYESPEFDLHLSGSGNGGNVVSAKAIPIQTLYTHHNTEVQLLAIETVPVLHLAQFYMLLALLKDDLSTIKTATIDKIVDYLGNRGVLITPPEVYMPDLDDTDIPKGNEMESKIPMNGNQGTQDAAALLSSPEVIINVQLARNAYIRICSLIEDCDIEIRVKACEVLGQFAHRGLITVLFQSLSKVPLVSIRGSLALDKGNQSAYHFYLENRNLSLFVRSLPGRMDDVTVPYGLLTRAVEDEYVAVRLAALDTIFAFSMEIKIFFKEAQDLMVDMFNDEQAIVRLRSIWLMYKCGLKYNIVLTTDQLDSILTVLQDELKSVRMAAYRLLSVVFEVVESKTNVESEKNSTGRPLSSLVRFIQMVISGVNAFPDDLESIYACIAGIGRVHANRITIDIISELLQVNSHYLAQEQHIENKIHIAHVILLCNAASTNSAIAEYVPSYIRTRFDYVQLQYPEICTARPKLNESKMLDMVSDRQDEFGDSNPFNSYDVRSVEQCMMSLFTRGRFNDYRSLLNQLISDITDLLICPTPLGKKDSLGIICARVRLSYYLCCRWTLDIIQSLSTDETIDIDLIVEASFKIRQLSIALTSIIHVQDTDILQPLTLFFDLACLIFNEATALMSDNEQKSDSKSLLQKVVSELRNIMEKSFNIRIETQPRVMEFTICNLQARPVSALAENCKTITLQKSEKEDLFVNGRKNSKQGGYRGRGGGNQFRPRFKRFGLETDSYYTNVREFLDIEDNYDKAYAEKKGVFSVLDKGTDMKHGTVDVFTIRGSSKELGWLPISEIVADGANGIALGAIDNQDMDRTRNSEELRIADFIFVGVEFPVKLVVDIIFSGVVDDIERVMANVIPQLRIVITVGSSAKSTAQFVRPDVWRVMNFDDDGDDMDVRRRHVSIECTTTVLLDRGVFCAGSVVKLMFSVGVVSRVLSGSVSGTQTNATTAWQRIGLLDGDESVARVGGPSSNAQLWMVVS